MVKQIAVHRLKYLDEASFASRGAPPPPPPPDARAPTAGARPLAAELRRQRGVAPCGAPAVATNGDSLCEHYSVTIMVGLPPVGQPDAPTVFVNYRADGTNKHGV